MKKYLIFCSILILTAVIAAGCTSAGSGGKSTDGASLPSEVTGKTTAAATSTEATFATGDHYLEKSYSFHSESDLFTEQLRIDDPSWAITFFVVPLNDDPQNCWFEMTVTNSDSKKSRIYGFGRTYAYDTFQQYPMYTTGPYTIQMKGNRVKVNLDVAKRLP